jgi:PBP1b-binding outer membrane lipoprotein LpoB
MKIKSIVLALALSAALFSGCSTRPVARPSYHESQFSSRVEYLRFCQQYDPLARNCH